MWLAGDNSMGCQYGQMTYISAFVLHYAEKLVDSEGRTHAVHRFKSQ